MVLLLLVMGLLLFMVCFLLFRSVSLFLFMGWFLSTFLMMGFLILGFFMVGFSFGNVFALLFRLFVGLGSWFYLCFYFWFYFSCLLLLFWFGFGFSFLFGFLSFRFFALVLAWLLTMWLIWSSELSLNTSDTGPVFKDLSLLSSHFNEKSSGEDFFIVAVFDKIDGIDSHFENDFKWSRVVVFDFNKFELWKSFFDVFFSSVEIALDQVEGDMLNILIEIFDLLD